MRKTAPKVSSNGKHRVAEEFFSALNIRDVDDILTFFSDEASCTFPGTSALGGFYLGKKKIKRFLEKLYIFVPDICFQVLGTFTSEKALAVEWISTGISKKNIPYENRGVSLLVVENDRIMEMRHYLDTERLRNP
jgi:ketosteroid isomerase-like protein